MYSRKFNRISLKSTLFRRDFMCTLLMVSCAKFWRLFCAQIWWAFCAKFWWAFVYTIVYLLCRIVAGFFIHNWAIADTILVAFCAQFWWALCPQFWQAFAHTILVGFVQTNLVGFRPTLLPALCACNFWRDLCIQIWWDFVRIILLAF
jgi:hypothetical protein